MVCACAFSKGRPASPGLNAVFRQVASLLLCSGCALSVRWIPSERNPADAASRGERQLGYAGEGRVGVAPADGAARSGVAR
eukprot:1460606-Lingulodinium_polyedra.AAC.1